MNILQWFRRLFWKRVGKPFIRKNFSFLSDLMAGYLEETPGNPAHDILYNHGFHLLRKHYYLPIPEEEDLTGGFWDKTSDLAGVDMNAAFALDLMENVFPQYMEEFRSKFPIHATSDLRQFHLINGAYMAVDAHVYYAFIRHFKPRRILEIGSGNSTILAGQACLQNESEGFPRPELIAVEPYPWDMFVNGECPGLGKLIKSRVQDVDIELFQSLGDGDILFIDSSHVLKSGGDVQMEYLEILPRLAPGVLVHIHDISLPRAYPISYYENYLYWNEQYLLQAFLAFNSRFEVIWPGNYMRLNFPEPFDMVFPEFQTMRQHYPLSEPSAFWMRTRK